ncbi:DUF4097 family beta strand repeat-containing protein [Adhaeribacter pallidiroseus]|uniref:Adhesin domain-containing protein n=1 Tax=Adhaeribacter pallidiroseus TaxID=2072847 RepID=A0A369QG06_9BACT|nr:DUF4097 family beta strand repeat-containing protein [Adhaeribacter pallidiroseus]RDC62197.1 hypothetical protein AHMF7616_00788 [Adhaeribacter pallidiroseus]
MKKINTILLVMLLTVATLATGFISSAEDNKPYQVKDFTINGAGKLQAKTSGGSLKVTGGSGSRVKVKVFVKPANWKNRLQEPSAEALAKYTIDVRQEGNTIYAVAERKDKSWNKDNALSIGFEMEVPEQMACNLRTSGGSISLESVTGDQDVETSGGSLNFKNIKGNLDANTSGGSIELAHYQGNLNAQTSGGSINLNSANGRLKAHTSGGSIHLNEVAGDIDAHTSGGSIHADVKSLGKYLTLETSGGSVHATVPGGKGLDLDLEGNRVKTALTNFNGTSDTRRVKGTVNGGGIPVKMSTSGGTTELSYRM